MLDAFFRTLLLKCTYAKCFFKMAENFNQLLTFVLALFTSEAQPQGVGEGVLPFTRAVTDFQITQGNGKSTQEKKNRVIGRGQGPLKAAGKKNQSISSIALFVYESTQASEEVPRENP